MVRVRRDDHRARLLPRDRLKRHIDFTRRAGLQHKEPHPDRMGGGLACELLIGRPSTLFGLTISATSASFGTSSRSSSICFGPNSVPNQLTPVRLASGRLRLLTSPAAIGSPPLVNTIGIVEVSALAAKAGGLPPVAAMAAT